MHAGEGVLCTAIKGECGFPLRLQEVSSGCRKVKMICMGADTMCCGIQCTWLEPVTARIVPMPLCSGDWLHARSGV